MQTASTTFRAYNAVRGWVDQPDLIAIMAQRFAEQLGEVTCVRALGDADEDDAAKVNKAICMIAKNAEALIAALVADAYRNDLVAEGEWLDAASVEQRAFDVEKPDHAAGRADYERDMRREVA